MPNFQTHISASSVVGFTYASWGYLSLELSAPTVILAGGLCAVSGMLPDVDSDSGIPLREVMMLLASTAPLMLMKHFVAWGLTPESMVLAGASLYVAIRFGLGELVRRYTIHRGMWHSIPAALIAALAAMSLLCLYDDVQVRVFKAGGVFLGYLSHLLLDTMQDYQLGRSRSRLQTALGSPIKLWRQDAWANISTYGKLLAVFAWVCSDTQIMRHYGWERSPMYLVSREIFEQAGLRPLRPGRIRAIDEATWDQYALPAPQGGQSPTLGAQPLGAQPLGAQPRGRDFGTLSAPTERVTAPWPLPADETTVPTVSADDPASRLSRRRSSSPLPSDPPSYAPANSNWPTGGGTYRLPPLHRPE